MLTMHPTLLIGPSDWDPDVMPRAEFVDRIDALWQSDPQAERAVIFGNSAHHAELAYFTNFVPKLEATIAILSRTGAHRLLVGGGPNMMGAARPLTFIENVTPLKDVGETIRADRSGGRTLLIGAGYMPVRLRTAITEAIGADAAQDATAQTWRQMSRKSGREIDVIRRARAIAGAGEAAMLEALRPGTNVSAVIAAGEQAAYTQGAQDVRTLFSLDNGKTYRPFLAPIERVIDPLHVYLAIRHANYWVDRFALISRDDEVDPVLEKVIAARAAAIRLIKAGTRTSDVASVLKDVVGPGAEHPMTARAFGQRMGLALEEPPWTDLGPTFEDREVYALRVGASDGARHHVVSAMIRVLPDGNDLL